jgi:hypothetical protein
MGIGFDWGVLEGMLPNMADDLVFIACIFGIREIQVAHKARPVVNCGSCYEMYVVGHQYIVMDHDFEFPFR